MTNDPTQHFDAIVIGTGQAGPSLAARLASEGLHTAVIERDRFGGTCVNTGCTPTKALVASAQAAHVARRGSSFGVEVDGEIKVDMKKVKARKDALVSPSTEGIEQWLSNTENLTVFKGHARFQSANTVEVGDQTLQADKIFINVGGRAKLPEYASRVDHLTNSSIMDVDFVPKHLVIIGGSYIGLEFGQMYHRFGSRVTIIEKGKRLLTREDEDISEEVLRILEDEGIEVRLGAQCIGASNDGNGVRVDVDCEAGAPTVQGSHLLLAVGRVPNTDDLGLDKAGIATNERGFVEVNDSLETNVDGIWALGDCNGRGAFTHTAYNDFEIVADQLFGSRERKVTDRFSCYALYMDPPLARVGMNEAEARESGRKVLKATRPMKKVARAKEKGETDGFMKVLVDAETKQILGAAILGVGGDEIIHSIIDVMYARQPYTLIQRAVHIHPTVSELIPTMLGDLKPLDE